MNKNMYLSDFYCTKCGKKGISVPRFKGKDRESGHLKKLWCPWCQSESNHAEVRGYGSYTYDDFLMEFKLGRFVDGERIAIAELKPCNILNCEYNVEGRCWRANKNFECVQEVNENE